MPKPAGTRYHRQNQTNYCGAAAAMMMLSDGDIGVPIKDLDQKRLYEVASENPKVSDWIIHPKGLSHVLNEAGKGSFEIYTRDKIEEAQGMIAAVLDQRWVAPAILANADHWVVVNEMRVESGKLKSVVVHDPWNPVDDPPVTHSESDSCAGYYDGEIMAQEWRDVFVKCDCLGSGKHGFLLVAAGLEADAPRLESFIPEPVSDGSKLLDPHWLQDNFNRIIEHFRVEESLPFGASPGLPQLVLHLEKLSFYYLVPIFRDNKLIGTSSFGAMTGDLESLQFLNPASALDTLLGIPRLREGGREGVLNHLAETLGGLDILRGKVSPHRLNFERLSISETLVWQSCQQSRSKYLPFWRVRLLGQEIYLRIDGAIFFELTRGLLGA
jgi:hypothetical protein